MAAKNGYKVIVHGRTDTDDLKQVHREIEGSMKVVFDVTDRDAVAKALEGIEQIDVLVNNAGWVKPGISDVQDINDEDAIYEYKVNVLGGLHCIQSVLPGMLERGSGSIVSVSSIKGHYSLGTLSSLTYAPSKAGVISLSKTLAKSYPSVRFNTVSPGYIETDQAKGWDETVYAKIEDGTILERIGQPDEVANVIMFLASDSSSYVTGTDYLVDGGYSIKGK